MKSNDSRDAASTIRGRPQAAEKNDAARILIIDDEHLLGRTLRLAFHGYHELTVVTSGREALERLSRDANFDLVLCDLMMPEMSCMAVYEQITQRFPALADRVVFMTGGAFTDEARDFLDRHPDAQLEKPFDISDVQRMLQRMLDRPS